MYPTADAAPLWLPPSLTALHNPLRGHLIAAAGLQYVVIDHESSYCSILRFNQLGFHLVPYPLLQVL